MATLTYMPTEHVPVLASELIALPRPAAARSRSTAPSAPAATRASSPSASGPTGADLHRPRPGRRGALRPSSRTRLACRTRFIRADFAEPSPRSRDEGVRADIVYMDLGISSLQLDAWERGFSYSYDAPLDMRMDPTRSSPRPRSSTSGPSAARRGDPRLRRGAPRRRDRPRDRPPPAARDHLGARRGDPRRAAARGALRPRPSRQADLPGDPDRRQRRARLARPGACRRAWELLRRGGRLAAISFHSLEDRRVKRFLADLPAAAPARRSCRSAAAGTSPRPSC